MAQSNPQPSGITRAYLEARKVLVPQTDREALLVEALQGCLERLYDSSLHAECLEREKDAQDEVAKMDAAIEAVTSRVDLDAVHDLLRERRGSEQGGSLAGLMHGEWLRAEKERQLSDMIRDMAAELEAWRALR